MSIAQKLKTVAENQQKVYAAGYAAGQKAGGYGEGYEAGQQAEYDRFWDLYQNNGHRQDYQNAFSGIGWTEETYQPKYTIYHTGYPIYMVFRRCGFVDLGKAIRDSGKQVVLDHQMLQFTFQQCPNLEVIDGVSFPTPLTYISGAFANCAKLRKIQTLPISENATTLEFTNIPALEEISFSGVIPANISFAQSANLNGDSVESILDHLADLTAKPAKTLTLHATVGGKLTDAQKASVTAKNWTLVY